MLSAGRIAELLNRIESGNPSYIPMYPLHLIRSRTGSLKIRQKKAREGRTLEGEKKIQDLES